MASSTPIVELLGVGKTFPGVVALQAVDLALSPGTVHALVGENGAGKSTLINILDGLFPPDTGEIRVAGQPVHLASSRTAHQHGIVTVHQEVDLFADLTVQENIALLQGLISTCAILSRSHQRQRALEALGAVGNPVSPNMPARLLTPAQRQLVEIAAAVSQFQGEGEGARVLILDEPTSSLSDAEAHVLFDHLRKFRAHGTAIVYVSHRFEEIFTLADEVTVLRDGQRVWNGPLSQTSPTHLIRQMVGRDVPAGPAKSSTPAPGPARLACRGLTAADGSFHGITLTVHAGEVLGVYGLIGAGRTEWAQALVGLRQVAGGEVEIDGRLVRPTDPGTMANQGIVYVPEDRLRQGLCRGLTVRANAVLASLRQLAPFGWIFQGRESRLTNRIVQQLSVRLASIEQPIGSLSGGNQQKVVLGRWLERKPAVLLLDEPTRGVDVGAREEIYGILRRQAEAGKAVVLISSDLPEIVAQSDRVAVFREGQLVVLLDPRTCSAEDIATAALPDTTVTAPSAPGDPASPEATAASPALLERLRWLNAGLLFREAGLLTVVVIFFIVLHLLSGRFLQPDSLGNLFTDAALLCFCAVGAALVLLAGGLDISLGALMAFSAGVAGRLWEEGYPLPVVASVAVGLGAAGGALNAALTLAGRVHPIVVTLGTMSIYRGLTLWWLRTDVQIPDESRQWLEIDPLGLPLPVWLGLMLLIVVWLALSYTVPGRYLYALGSNPAAARRVSISKSAVWLGAFTVQGALVGLAGLLYLARSGQLQSTSHEDRTLEAIAAAVVGGVAITGGRGSVGGVALGCLFLVSLGPACIFLHISPHWQQTLVGSVLVVAVLIDTFWSQWGSEESRSGGVGS